jgi:hypothetical protein
MAALGSGSLQSIGGTFGLNELTILTSLSFPRLTTVDIIDWEALPALQALAFTTGVQKASSLSIQNTQLNSLDGINLQTVDSVLIANNNYLETIDMQLAYINTGLAIEANGRQVNASFPNLEWAFNITLRNVSSISFPSLSSVNGSLGFYSNFFESVSAPNLTSVGQSLSFVSNEDMTNASFPVLTTVGGGLQIANNTGIEDISGFPDLQSIGGALDFYGNFTGYVVTTHEFFCQSLANIS